MQFTNRTAFSTAICAIVLLLGGELRAAVPGGGFNFPLPPLEPPVPPEFDCEKGTTKARSVGNWILGADLVVSGKADCGWAPILRGSGLFDLWLFGARKRAFEGVVQARGGVDHHSHLRVKLGSYTVINETDPDEINLVDQDAEDEGSTFDVITMEETVGAFGTEISVKVTLGIGFKVAAAITSSETHAGMTAAIDSWNYSVSEASGGNALVELTVHQDLKFIDKRLEVAGHATGSSVSGRADAILYPLDAVYEICAALLGIDLGCLTYLELHVPRLKIPLWEY